VAPEACQLLGLVWHILQFRVLQSWWPAVVLLQADVLPHPTAPACPVTPASGGLVMLCPAARWSSCLFVS